MCGRYFRRSDKQRIAAAFKLGELPEGLVLPPDFNVAPTTFQPVIRNSKETGERELVFMRWGLIPSFAKSLNDARGISTINAKAENVTSGLWKVPFQRHRCLVPADGFYEWKALTAKTKQPYAFSLVKGEPLAFAGLWSAWKEPPLSADSGVTWLQSFTIITTNPNEITARVHSRMPVILRPSDYDRWLDRGETAQPPLDLLRPYDSAQMMVHAVDPRVGNVKNSEPELCDEFQCPPNSA